MGTVILAIVLLLATAARADDDLHIYALPVGQGDATIIRCPPKDDKRELVIIDIGSSSVQTNIGKGFMQIKDVNNFIENMGNHVEKVFLTHPDQDHYNLIAAASIRMDGNTIIYYSCSLKDYDNCWMTNNDGKPKKQMPTHDTLEKVIRKTNKYEYIQKKDCRSKATGPCIRVCGNTAIITVLASELGDSTECSNEDSLVLQLKYKKKKVLFVGDIEGGAIGTIAQCDIKSDILRLSHHGSVNNHANYNGFLRAVDPTYAFSSSDPCHHPTWTHPSCYIPSWFAFMRTNHLLHDKHPYTCRWPNKPDGTRDIIYYNKEYGGPCYSTTTTEDCENFQHWILDFEISESGITLYRHMWDSTPVSSRQLDYINTHDIIPSNILNKRI